MTRNERAAAAEPAPDIVEEIAHLRRALADLEARLAAPTVPDVTPAHSTAHGHAPAPVPHPAAAAPTTVTARRHWLKGAGVLAAGVGLANAFGAETASANVSQTAPTTNASAAYGLSAAPATTTPSAPASGTYGVIGVTDSAMATGLANPPTTSAGVLGGSTAGVGVYGYSASGIGVDANAGDIGIRGTGTNYGLVGASGTGQGLNGQSTSGIGLVGSSGGSQPGVYGSSVSGPGVFGTTSGGGYAGVFNGPVQISGSLSVTGIKSAVVPHPDGSTRRMYCLESPESYFEDFGSAQLVQGRADVTLDADFAAVVRTDAYLVYLTPEGDSQGLYVAAKTPTRFTVREQRGGTSTLTFSYRVVAKRRDVQAARLAQVAPAPRVVTPRLPAIPPRPARP